MELGGKAEAQVIPKDPEKALLVLLERLTNLLEVCYRYRQELPTEVQAALREFEA